eukprot:1178713-Prorocentrum_minimum.AAC.1
MLCIATPYCQPPPSTSSPAPITRDISADPSHAGGMPLHIATPYIGTPPFKVTTSPATMAVTEGGDDDRGCDRRGCPYRQPLIVTIIRAVTEGGDDDKGMPPLVMAVTEGGDDDKGMPPLVMGGNSSEITEGIRRSSLDAREPQNPTTSEEYQRHLQGVLYRNYRGGGGSLFTGQMDEVPLRGPGDGVDVYLPGRIALEGGEGLHVRLPPLFVGGGRLVRLRPA